MGEEARELERKIDRARGALGRDIEAFEEKVEDFRAQVRNNLDWRYQFDQRPAVLLGLAFGVGALLSLVTPRSRRASEPRA